jgi:hypothetical protein
MPSSLLTDRPDDLLEGALIVLFAHWHTCPAGRRCRGSTRAAGNWPMRGVSTRLRRLKRRSPRSQQHCYLCPALRRWRANR